MIANISPSEKHFDETLNTLKWATRTKDLKIQNYRKMIDKEVGEVSDKALLAEMVKLKNQVKTLKI